MKKNSDIALCKALEGGGAEIAEMTVYCVQRGGYLLLALPSGRDAALATLKLYQPQVFKGKLLALVVSILVSLGLHRLLTQKLLVIREGGPLAALVSGGREIGFLLGNPEADIRRALVLHNEGGAYVVDKVGIGEKSRKSVLSELEVIKTLSSEISAVPSLYGESGGDQWASYSTRFVRGRSPRRVDDGRVLDLLFKWLKKSESATLLKTSQWSAMKTALRANGDYEFWDRLAGADVLEVKQGVFHGDFAPWNIKVLENGCLTVLDWEHGSRAGPAGWDWLHYLIQRATLVDDLPVNETMKACRKWAGSDRGRDFLDRAGWGGQTELWIGTYLAYSSWVAGFDREELLTEWMRK